MSLKGLLFIGLFGFCVVGAVFLPHLGIYGYLADYCINPSDQWWGRPFANMGLRVSFTLALATMAGMVFQWKKLRFGDALLYPQEKTLLVFLALVWLLVRVCPEKENLLALADSLGNAEHVVWLGAVGHDDVWALMSC